MIRTMLWEWIKNCFAVLIVLAALIVLVAYLIIHYDRTQICLMPPTRGKKTRC